MPWQQHVADVGCEYDPETGIPYYREVGITVPRQSGKTTTNLTWEIDRALFWRRAQRIAFTAQSGKDARDKHIDEIFPLLRTSAVMRFIRQINEGMGNESVRFRTGSIIRLLSTSASAGHSKTLDLAVMDEIWADEDDRREQGLRPAMITRRDAQLLWSSTAGTAASTVYNRKVEAGRLAVAEDTGHGIAYFEWSAPDDWDPDDEDSYFTFMPALCPDPPCRCGAGEGWRHTITLETLRSERSAMRPGEYRRAFGNRPSGESDSLFPADVWAQVCIPNAKPKPRYRLGLEVDPDGAWGALAIFGRDTVELIEHKPGTSWVVQRANAISAKRDADVAIDARGPAKRFARQIKRAKLIDADEMMDACADMYEAISDGRVKFRSDPSFDDAVAGAVKKIIGDRWVWSRKASSADVTPLIAATLARGGKPPGKKPPLFISLREDM